MVEARAPALGSSVAPRRVQHGANAAAGHAVGKGTLAVVDARDPRM